MVDSSRTCLPEIPANNYFSDKKVKNKHALRVFKHLVFVNSRRTQTLLSGYSISSDILVPLNLKIDEKPIKTGKRKTCGGQKLRFMALEILIGLSLHNGTQSKQFYFKYL